MTTHEGLIYKLFYFAFSQSSFLFTIFLFPIGVRCDACMAHDFRGLRYKCLRCDDYDLCPNCFSNGAATSSHTSLHPMQCILTANDFGTEFLSLIYLI